MTPGARCCAWCGKVNLSKDWGAFCGEVCWDEQDAWFEENWQQLWDEGEKSTTGQR